LTNHPILITIKNLENTGKHSKVLLQYYVDDSHKGLEIMGVNAGLSWLKNKSLSADYKEFVEEGWNLFEAVLELEDRCEFRGRSFTDINDYWEEGENHQLERLPSGNIKFNTTPEILETIQFQGTYPFNWAPSVEEAEMRLRKEGSQENFLQYLIDSIIYVYNWLDRPKVLFLILHKIIKNIRDKVQQISSEIVDQQVLPLLKIYYEMLMEIRSSDETQDSRILPGTFEKRKYDVKMMEILDKLTENPILNPELNITDEERQKDDYLRLRKLLAYL
jgi:hypothetical protein